MHVLRARTQKRFSLAVLLVDCRANLDERFPFPCQWRDQLGRLPASHAPGGLLGLEAGEQRAVAHAVMTLTGTAHAVEDLGVPPGGVIGVVDGLRVWRVVHGPDVRAPASRTGIVERGR